MKRKRMEKMKTLDKRYIDIISKIVQTYSKEKQVGQAIEEMAELIVELNKNINRNKNNKKEITLELADVIVMTIELVMIYKIDIDKLYGAIEYKLERQKSRMNNEKNKDLNCMTD
jgi:NTP pyrophosphatase (non-canonical NTP hydrolase)